MPHSPGSTWTREQRNRYQREWRRTPHGRAKTDAYTKAWMERNPAAVKYKRMRLSARRRGIPCANDSSEFVQWYNAQPRICTYCGIPEESILAVFGNKQFSKLTTDRKSNELGYVVSNLCLCCYKCNTTKNDYIPHEVMLRIGTYLRPLWEAKLKEATCPIS